MTSSDDSDRRTDHEASVGTSRGEGLRSVLTELTYPAPVWLLVAHAHSWGADAESVGRLNQLPVKDYQGPDDVLHALGYPASAPPERAQAPPERTPAPPERTPEPEPGVASAQPRGAPASELNKAAQHKVVGEGLAVGLLALGVEAVTINQHLLESAFAHAWHSWTCSSWFPQVRATDDNNDVVAILRSSARRKGPQIANWSTEGEYAPRMRVDSTIDEAGRMVGKPAGVAQHQWLALARGFVSQFSEQAGEIRYRG